MGENPARFDSLRRKAESKMQMGGGSPETSASVMRMQNASLRQPEESLGLASVQRDFGNSCSCPADVLGRVDFSGHMVAQFDEMFWRRRT